MAQINIRIDDELKKKADNLFDKLGMNMTTAVNVFIAQSVRQGEIPFPITTQTDPFYSEANIHVLKESIEQAEQGKLTAHDLLED